MKKLKTKCNLLALAAMLSTTPAALAGGNGISVGDMRGYGDDAYFSNTEPVQTQQQAPPMAEPTPQYDDVVYDDVDTNLSPVAYVGDTYFEPAMTSDPSMYGGMSGTMSGDCGCGSTSCGGCSTGSCESAKRMRPMQKLACKTDGWMTAEALLWFPQARAMPALVTGSPSGDLARLGEDDTAVLYGGQSSAFATRDAMDGGMSPGFRIDGGRYLADGFGVGGRFWWLGNNETEFAGASDGLNGSLGRPFFDTELGGENAILLGFDDDGVAGNNTFLPSFNGDVTASTKLEMMAAEAYARMRMLSCNGFHADMLGGYSYFGINDELNVTSRQIQTNIDGATNGQPGDTTIFRDLIQTENTFHGGQLGMESVLARGGWTLRMLTKVHLGNMNQQWAGNGQSTFIPQLDVTNQTVGENRGALVLNDQTIERDVFTFAPEINLKLGYQFRKNVALTVGYSFLYWNDVAMVGDNLNNVFDRDALVAPYPNTTPAGQPFVDGLRDASLWVQGVDLGCVIEF